MNSEKGQQIRRRSSLLGSGVEESKDKVIISQRAMLREDGLGQHSPPLLPLLQQMQLNNGDGPSPARCPSLAALELPLGLHQGWDMRLKPRSGLPPRAFCRSQLSCSP